MSDFMRDEELDALVRELNRTRPEGGRAARDDEAPAVTGAPTVARRAVSDDDPLAAVLAQIVQREATDLLLVPGSPPVVRVAGRLAVLDAPALDEEDLRSLLAPHLSAQIWQGVTEHGSA